MNRPYEIIDSAGRSWQELQPTISARQQQQAGKPDVYWCCNNQPVWSKYQAMKRLGAGQTTHFYCYDRQWAAADWTKPVQDPVDHLLIERAKAIRHNNKFVRIWYSGGADSHTVLKAFQLAGLAPEEIVFYTWCHRPGSFFNNNFEIERAVIPYIDQLKQWFPDTRIINGHIDLALLRALRGLHTDYPTFALEAGIRSQPICGVSALFDQLEMGPGIINITGGDKPRLDYINGQWYAWSTDTSMLHSWGKYVEAFFQCSDPTIFIRQCHDMKNYLTKNLSVINRQTVLRSNASRQDQRTRRAVNQALGRHQPFDNSANARKWSKRPVPGIGEFHPKAVLLYRELQRKPEGPELLAEWERRKKQFATETGYCPTLDVFGRFYNLDTGEIHTVDELFPQGWHDK